MIRPLSEAERALVERYHSLIYRVLGDLHLGADAAADLYGDAALGLVFAAQQYLTEERLQKYRFSDVAYSRIRNALMRQRHKARKAPVMLSLDAWQKDGGTLYDVLPDGSNADPAEIRDPQGAQADAPSARCAQLQGVSVPGLCRPWKD